MQVATEALQQLLQVRTATRHAPGEHDIASRSTDWPQPGLPGLILWIIRVHNLNRGLIDLQVIPVDEVLVHPVVDRFEHLGALGHPAHHALLAQGYLIATENLRLAVKWQMIDVFA